MSSKNRYVSIIPLIAGLTLGTAAMAFGVSVAPDPVVALSAKDCPSGFVSIGEVTYGESANGVKSPGEPAKTIEDRWEQSTAKRLGRSVGAKSLRLETASARVMDFKSPSGEAQARLVLTPAPGGWKLEEIQECA